MYVRIFTRISWPLSSNAPYIRHIARHNTAEQGRHGAPSYITVRPGRAAGPGRNPHTAHCLAAPAGVILGPQTPSGTSSAAATGVITDSPLIPSAAAGARGSGCSTADSGGSTIATTAIKPNDGAASIGSDSYNNH